MSEEIEMPYLAPNTTRNELDILAREVADAGIELRKSWQSPDKKDWGVAMPRYDKAIAAYLIAKQKCIGD